MNKTFNLIIVGVGGQGVVTLLAVIDEAAVLQGYEVRSSELHGLSQRGGSVQAHVRFGKKVYSPLVRAGSADLIIGMELLEALRGILKFAYKNTRLVVNKYSFPLLGGLPEAEILNKLPKKNINLVSASQICKQNLQNEVVSSLYLLGCAVKEKLIPLKKESVLQAIKNIVPEKYLDLNINAFELAYG